MVQCRWPESLTSDLVGELVNGDAKLLESSPRFIECSLTAVLSFIPGGHVEVVNESLGKGYDGWIGGVMEMRRKGNSEILKAKNIYFLGFAHENRKQVCSAQPRVG